MKRRARPWRRAPARERRLSCSARKRKSVGGDTQKRARANRKPPPALRGPRRAAIAARARASATECVRGLIRRRNALCVTRSVRPTSKCRGPSPIMRRSCMITGQASGSPVHFTRNTQAHVAITCEGEGVEREGGEGRGRYRDWRALVVIGVGGNCRWCWTKCWRTNQKQVRFANVLW